MRYLAITIVMAVSLSGGAASAEVLQRGDTVIDRSRPDYDAIGMRAGVFTLYPAAIANLVKDDNIFADDSLKADDLIFVVAPELIALADWGRADLELGADLKLARYSDFDNEDYEDWSLWADLEAALGRGQVSGLLRYADLHEERTSADDRRGITPTEYTETTWNVGWRNPFANFIFIADAGQRILEYDDTETLSGPQSNADRDRTQSDLRARVGYSVSSRFQPFVRIRLTDVEYDQTFDTDGFFRSSSGYDLVGGTEIDLGGQTYGEVFLGYIERDYEDTRFSDVSGAIFGAELIWNVTGLTTLQFSANRDIQPTTIIGAAGITETAAAAAVDHELLRNVILSLDLGLTNQDFEGIDRTDDIFKARLEGMYLLNRYLHLMLGVEIEDRSTSPSGSGVRVYDRQRYYLGIRGQI